MMQAPGGAPGTTRKIVMFAFDGVELLDVAGPLEAFATAAALIGGPVPSYTVEIASEKPGKLRSSSGLTIESACALSDLHQVDTLLIAGGAAVEQACGQPAVVATLREQAGRVRRLGSVCTGAMLLAEAGLLDGRRAVTHWNWCARLAGRYPKVKVESAPIYIVDGQLWTSAGVTAGIDMALAMIEDDFSAPVALRVARELVMFRAGGDHRRVVRLSKRRCDAARFSTLFAGEPDRIPRALYRLPPHSPIRLTGKDRSRQRK